MFDVSKVNHTSFLQEKNMVPAQMTYGRLGQSPTIFRKFCRQCLILKLD